MPNYKESTKQQRLLFNKRYAHTLATVKLMRYSNNL